MLERARRVNGGEATRLCHYAQQAGYVEDPLICEPHGHECCTEPPGGYSDGAMMYLDDGAVGYAKPLWRRGWFDPGRLVECRRAKSR